MSIIDPPLARAARRRRTEQQGQQPCQETGQRSAEQPGQQPGKSSAAQSGESAAGRSGRHRVVELLARFEQTRAELADTHTWSLADAELREALPRVRGLISALEEVEARLLVEADRRGLGERDGHHDTATWYASVTQLTRPTAKGLLRFARHLDTPPQAPVREALSAGGLNSEQARAVTTAITKLTDHAADYAISPDQIHHAAQHLASLAADHDARELRILGHHIIEVIAPDLVDDYHARLLEAEEARAAARTRFSIRPDGHGMMRGSFAIPELAGAMLKKHLDALAAPRHHHTNHTPGPTNTPEHADPPEHAGSSGAIEPSVDAATVGTSGTSGTPVARPLRLGEAFVEYIQTRAVDEDGMPYAGGLPATIVVTMTHQALTGQLETAGVLDTGETISAATARRLACQAGLIPAVLGTPSHILDLGRKTRFHTEPQRIAIAHRDKGCAEQHCDWPPGMCHIHHTTPWSHGGPTNTTNTTNAIMLCPRHHALAHHPDYQMTTTPHHTIRFTRRC